MTYPFRYLLETNALYPALFLDFWWSRRARFWVAVITRALLAVFLFVLAVLPWIGRFDYFGGSLEGWQAVALFLVGWWFVLAGVWIFVSLLEFFFRSRVANSLRRDDAFGGVSFLVGRLLYRAREADLVVALFHSDLASELLDRLGLTFRDVEPLLAARQAKGQNSSFNFKPGEIIDLGSLAALLYSANNDLGQWLVKFDLSESEWRAAASWVEKRRLEEFAAERWWSPERLESVPALMSEGTFGAATPDYLARLSENPLTAPETAVSHLSGVPFRASELAKLEESLANRRDARLIVSGDTAAGRLALISSFAALVASGRARPALAGTRVIVLRSSALAAMAERHDNFEYQLRRALLEAESAGRLILVVDDLAAFLAAIERAGLTPSTFLNRFFTAGKLRWVLLADQASLNQISASGNDLPKLFELLSLPPFTTEQTISLLQAVGSRLEKNSERRLSYPALVEIAQVAERYFAGEPLAEKAVELLVRLMSETGVDVPPLITRDVARDFFRQKMKLPLASLSSTEREQLAALPDLLNRKIVGQTEAIERIATVLKRARSGVSRSERPLASFLFLGPIGVGKTELAKALAEVFFPGGDNLIRLDLSEYTTEESLPRLLGVASSGKPGLLATLVRQKPYGVILFDEFEKVRPEILVPVSNLLQRGVFADALGQSVNGRNLVVVATSHAGADFLWQLIKEQKPETEWREALINETVKRGIFKAELLDRFDAVVVFHPLDQAGLKEVARKMLERLARRLAEQQGLTLELTDSLLGAAASLGANQEFGARPMLRFIEENIEAKIADKVVSGELQRGMKVNEILKL